jgi:hypothetical protein
LIFAARNTRHITFNQFYEHFNELDDEFGNATTEYLDWNDIHNDEYYLFENRDSIEAYYPKKVDYLRITPHDEWSTGFNNQPTCWK